MHNECIIPLINAALEQSIFQEATSTYEIINGFKIFGSKGLVGNTFNRNIFYIQAVKDGKGSFPGLINSFKSEALAAGADNLSIEAIAVVNKRLERYLNPASMRRSGFSFSERNSSINLFTSLLR